MILRKYILIKKKKNNKIFEKIIFKYHSFIYSNKDLEK